MTDDSVKYRTLAEIKAFEQKTRQDICEALRSRSVVFDDRAKLNGCLTILGYIALTLNLINDADLKDSLS